MIVPQRPSTDGRTPAQKVESAAPARRGGRGTVGRVTRTAAVVLLVAGGVAYADWMLQLFLPVRADLMTSFISELGVAGQPYSAVFRVADLTGGALLLAGGAAAWLGTRRWAVTWSSLLVFALCLVLEASLPLNATFTFAAILPKAGTHLWWARVSEPHGLASFGETLAFMVLFLSCTRALHRTAASATWRRVLIATGVTAILCGVVDAMLTAEFLMGGYSAALGLMQRIGVTLTAVWLAAAPAWLVLTQGSGAGSEAAEEERAVKQDRRGRQSAAR